MSSADASTGSQVLGVVLLRLQARLPRPPSRSVLACGRPWRRPQRLSRGRVGKRQERSCEVLGDEQELADLRLKEEKHAGPKVDTRRVMDNNTPVGVFKAFTTVRGAVNALVNIGSERRRYAGESPSSSKCVFS